MTSRSGFTSALSISRLFLLTFLLASATAYALPPTITGQDVLTTDEDTALVVTLDHLTVTDIDSTYPDDFTIVARDLPNDNYTAIHALDNKSVTITPDPDYNGLLSVQVKVNDGVDDSNDWPLAITVNAVNDAPTITGQDLLLTAEDTALVVTLGNLTVTDDDNNYPNDFTILAQAGANYTATPAFDNKSVTITPDADYNGLLSVGVRVNDGVDNSTNVWPLAITVNAANDLPTVTILAPADPSIFDFGTTINFVASATDVEDDDTTLTGKIDWTSDRDGVLGVDSGAISISTLSIGTHTITASVQDNDLGQASDSITVTITNNPPTVTITEPEDGLSTVFGTEINFVATATDDKDGDLTAQLVWTSSLDGPIGLTGSIIVSDLSVGVHTISASVTDSDGGPGLDSIGVTITNNAPVLTPIGLQSVVEDALISVPLSATDEVGQTLVFSSTPLPAFCAPLVDNGDGTGAINCSPTIGDAGDYLITVTVSDPVPVTDDETFTLTVVANEAPTATNVAIVVPPPGTLALGVVLTGDYVYVDAENDLEGISTFRWLRDGVAIPGEIGTTHTVVADDIEAALVFEVTPVALTGALQGLPVQSPEVSVANTAPSITGQVTNPFEVLEDSAIVVGLADLTVTDPDNTYPDDFTISAEDGVDYTQEPALDNKSVTITPVLDFSGPLTVVVRVNDGFADSPPFDLAITVTPENDAPIITGVVAPLSTPEDTPLEILITDLTVTDPDNTFPTDFTLVLQPGLNYTLIGNEVTPAQDFNGLLTVPATVSDGELTSDVFDLTLTVASVNDVPTLDTPIEDQQAVEDSPFNLNISGNFSDPEGDTLTYTVAWVPVKPPSISFNSQTGVFSGTPRAADANPPGPTYTATVTARDTDGDFATDDFDLTVSLRDRANLRLTIEVAPETGMPGDELQWTLTARNPVGPQPGQNVELVGSFVGAGLTVALEGGATCTVQPTVDDVTDYVCQLGSLPVGGNTATVFTTTTSVVSEVVAFATVAGAQVDPIDPNLDDNSGFLAAAVGEAFSVGAVQNLGTSDIRSVIAGDVNGDGLNDLVIGTAAGQAVQVFVNDVQNEACQCQRDFVRSAIAVAGTNSASNEGVALADFDSNGTLDLVVVNGGGLADMVYSNDGSGNFTPMATLGNSFGQAVAAGDFNNDGNWDIAVAAVGGNPVYHGNGSGGFSLHATLGNANSLDVAVAEFDSNARDDLVFANVGSASRVWTKNGGAGFTSHDLLNIGDAVSVAAGNLGGDVRPDLVFGRVPTDVGDIPANPVMINSGDGTFPNAPAHLLGISPTNDVHIGDIDGDGRQDVVFVNSSGVHQIWSSNGIAFDLHREQIIDPGAVAGVLAHMGDIATGDDGGIDFAMGGALGGGLGVYLNDGAGNLGRGDTVAPVITLTGSSSVAIESGQNYVDSGATAMDNIGGDISTSINVASTVDTSRVGSYTVTYNVSDFAGNAAATVTRTVRVDPAANSGGGGGSVSYWSVAVLFAWFLVVVIGRTQQRRVVRLHTDKSNDKVVK
jgi:hypothetical protein